MGEIQRKRKGRKVSAVMYTSPRCCFCRFAKDYLNEQGVKVKEIDISTNDELREELRKKVDRMGVPFIVIKGENIVGFNKTRINEVLGIQAE